jgi:hypothetical protein
MPDPTVLVGENLPERGVHQVPLPETGMLVDRRAHQRMQEPQPVPDDFDEPGGDSGCEVIHCRPPVVEDGGGVQRLGHELAVVERGHEQQHPGRGR